MRIKSGLLINVLSTLIFLSLSANVYSQAEESWHPSKETLDKLSKDQPEINYFEEKVPAYTLPPLLTALNGTIVKNAIEWEKIGEMKSLNCFVRMYMAGFRQHHIQKVIN